MGGRSTVSIRRTPLWKRASGGRLRGTAPVRTCGKLLASHTAIIPRQFFAPNEDALLVTFSGEQHRITGSRHGKGARDARAAVHHAGKALPLARAGLNSSRRDLTQNGFRVFFARVLIGDDREVGQPRGSGAHVGPLYPVAVARRPEDGDQPPTGDGTQDFKDFGQTLRCVGVVHDHSERLAFVNALHAPGYAAEM